MVSNLRSLQNLKQ